MQLLSRQQSLNLNYFCTTGEEMATNPTARSLFSHLFDGSGSLACGFLRCTLSRHHRLDRALVSFRPPSSEGPTMDLAAPRTLITFSHKLLLLCEWFVSFSLVPIAKLFLHQFHDCRRH